MASTVTTQGKTKPAEYDVGHLLQFVEDTHNILSRAVSGCLGWLSHPRSHILDMRGPLCQVGLMDFTSGGGGGIVLRELALRARFSRSLKVDLAAIDSNRVT